MPIFNYRYFMNSIHKINQINQKELESNVSDEASWHADYKDTSYIYVGNLHESLLEKDILTIFSQYGNPTHINLIRDKDTEKSRGFCYLKYEDYRSCVLAVDNFNGTKIYEKPLRVDHTYYKLREGQSEDDFAVDYSQAITEMKAVEKPKEKPKLLPYQDLTEKLETNVDDDLADPMAALNNDDFDDPMARMLNKETERKRHRSGGRHRSLKSHKLEHRLKSDSQGYPDRSLESPH